MKRKPTGRTGLRTGAALLALGLAASAWAQGTFYREVEKDGRIYVFNIMRQFQAWEQSGEMGVAITLLGYGPNGGLRQRGGHPPL